MRRIGARGTLASLIAIAGWRGARPWTRARLPPRLRRPGRERPSSARRERRSPTPDAVPHGQADRAARSFPHRVGGPRRAPWITGGRPPLLAPSLTTGQLARTVAFAGILETLRVLGLRIDFQTDRLGSQTSTPDGRFDLRDGKALGIPIDPPPHNRAFFLSHLQAPLVFPGHLLRQSDPRIRRLSQDRQPHLPARRHGGLRPLDARPGVVRVGGAVLHGRDREGRPDRFDLSASSTPWRSSTRGPTSRPTSPRLAPRLPDVPDQPRGLDPGERGSGLDLRRARDARDREPGRLLRGDQRNLAHEFGHTQGLPTSTTSTRSSRRSACGATWTRDISSRRSFRIRRPGPSPTRPASSRRAWIPGARPSSGPTSSR